MYLHFRIALASPDATTKLATAFGSLLKQRIAAGAGAQIIYLFGRLGAGKSFFSRSLIQAQGHQGYIPSPTYSLVENYEFADFNLLHCDFYRLQGLEEFELIGGKDLLLGKSTCALIEWPDDLCWQFYPNFYCQFYAAGPEQRVLYLAFNPDAFQGKLQALVPAGATSATAQASLLAQLVDFIKQVQAAGLTPELVTLDPAKLAAAGASLDANGPFMAPELLTKPSFPSSVETLVAQLQDQVKLATVDLSQDAELLAEDRWALYDPASLKACRSRAQAELELFRARKG